MGRRRVEEEKDHPSRLAHAAQRPVAMTAGDRRHVRHRGGRRIVEAEVVARTRFAPKTFPFPSLGRDAGSAGDVAGHGGPGRGQGSSGGAGVARSAVAEGPSFITRPTPSVCPALRRESKCPHASTSSRSRLRNRVLRKSTTWSARWARRAPALPSSCAVRSSSAPPDSLDKPDALPPAPCTRPRACAPTFGVWGRI